MKKYFKLGDLVIFVSIFIIALICLFVSLNVFSSANLSSKFEIKYENNVLCAASIDEDATYTIKTNDDLSLLVIYKNGEEVNSIEFNKGRELLNVIEVKDNSIKMVEANCPNHNCMHMTLNQNHSLPIICVNGICVILLDTTSEIDVLS